MVKEIRDPNTIKVAKLLVGIEEEAADIILSALNENEVSLLSEVMKEINDLKPEDLKIICNDFQQSIMTFIPETDNKTSFLTDQTLSSYKDNQWESLQKINPNLFVKFLEQERVSTIAIILTQLANDYVAQIFNCLDPKIAVEVITYMMRYKPVSNEILEDIRTELEKRFLFLQTNETVVGDKKVLNILKLLNKKNRTLLMDKLSTVDKDLYQNIFDSMFDFADLASLSQEAFVKLMPQIPQEILAQSLVHASSEVKNKILQLFPIRTKAFLQERIRTLGNISVAQSQAAQEVIVKKIKELDNEKE